MRKLKEKVIDKLIAAKATSAEVDFVVWLSHHQDVSGLVRGVYYRDICDSLHILSPQTFYNVKNSLEAKGIIEVCKDDSWHGDWDIRILDNDFSNEDFRPGKIQGSYLNMGLSVFYSREFFEMKANEKLMTMLYIKIAGVGSPNYHIGTALFFQKYTALFGVKERTLRDYLKGIKRFFAIGIKDRKYWISPLRKKVSRESGTTDRAERVKQVAGSLCRRFRLDAAQAYQAIQELMEDYTYRVCIDLETVFMESIQDLLIRRNDNHTERRKWKKRDINKKYLHKIFREHLPDWALTV